MLFQLRSEDTGIINANTFKEALSKANDDRTIWKISFNLENGEHVRLVRCNGANKIDKSQFIVEQISIFSFLIIEQTTKAN